LLEEILRFLLLEDTGFSYNPWFKFTFNPLDEASGQIAFAPAMRRPRFLEDAVKFVWYLLSFTPEEVVK